MKVLSVVGDTPGWTYISEIFHEMLPASTREAIRHPELAAEKTKAALEPILLEQFSHLDFDFCFCFRCLDRDSGWVSKVRLYKNDYSHSWYSLNRVEQASRSLGMDIVVYKEDVIPIKNDKDDQTERGYEPRAKPRRALFYKVFRGFHHVIIHINMVLFFIIYNFVNDTFKG